jgi:hypothetical protein
MYTYLFFEIVRAAAYLAAGLLIRSRCPKAPGTPFFVGGALATAGLTLLQLLMPCGSGNAWLFANLHWGFVLSFAAMAVLLVPKFALPSMHPVLRIAIIVPVALWLLHLLHLMSFIYRVPYLGQTINLAIQAALVFGAWKQIPASAAPAVAQPAPGAQPASGGMQLAGAAWGGESALEATGDRIPLPAGAARFAEMVGHIAPAAHETSSTAMGVAIIVGGFLAMFVFFALGLANPHAIAPLMITGLVALVVALFAGIKIVQRGQIASLAEPVRNAISSHLHQGEATLAIACSRRIGFDFWMHGMTPAGVVVFTNRRIFLLSFSSVFKSPRAALAKGEGVQIHSCDGADRAQAWWGGVMMPPALHLFASKFTLQPADKGKPVSYAMFLCGPHGATIKAIKRAMTAA